MEVCAWQGVDHGIGVYDQPLDPNESTNQANVEHKIGEYATFLSDF